MNQRSAVAAINKAGALLVFPIDNRKEPASLWSHFHPKKEMRWEWDDGGDDAVGDLWVLRAKLSTTREVIYTKWYRGRATYLSLELFPALLRALNPDGPRAAALGAEAKEILSLLEGESPLSTKEIKRMAGLQGRGRERVFEKAMKELWARLLIVAYGEVDDGAFPSLAVGSTRVLFESLWNQAFKTSIATAERKVDQLLRGPLGNQNLFARYFQSLKAKKQPPAKSARKRIHLQPDKGIRFEDL